MKKTLILSDIDGTFLADGAVDLPINREAVKRFKENGGLFTFSSGRCKISMKSVISDPENIVNAPAILANGSYVFDYKTEQRHYSTPMDGENALKAIRGISQILPEISIIVNRFEDFLTNEKPCGQMSGARQYANGVIAYDFDEMPKDGWNKVVVYGSGDALSRARKFVEDNYAGLFNLNFSCPTLMEILDPKSGKGAKASKLREHYKNLGIDLKIYAIGDYENDIDMLKEADVAVCPDNALDSIKKICEKVVCSNNEGAIAALICGIEDGSI